MHLFIIVSVFLWFLILIIDSFFQKMFVDALLGKVINDDELSSSSSFAIVSEKHNNGDDDVSTNTTLSVNEYLAVINHYIKVLTYFPFLQSIRRKLHQSPLFLK